MDKNSDQIACGSCDFLAVLKVNVKKNKTIQLYIGY